MRSIDELRPESLKHLQLEYMRVRNRGVNMFYLDRVAREASFIGCDLLPSVAQNTRLYAELLISLKGEYSKDYDGGYYRPNTR